MRRTTTTPALLLGALYWVMIVVAAAAGAVNYGAAFAPAAQVSSPHHRTLLAAANKGENDSDMQNKEPTTLTRRQVLHCSSSSSAAAVAIATAAASSVTLLNAQPALARGRATLEQSYDRYVPRISAGGEFYKGPLRQLIEQNDWQGIRRATAEPPKKSRKEDRSKPDGGFADRAALAGAFSDARVLSAADLFASAFSDNSISAKTLEMREKVEKLRQVVSAMNSAAQKALGEDDDNGGGFLGLGGGGKKMSPAELAKEVRILYVQGGTLWNEYIFAANKELPLRFEKLPYL